MKSITVSGRHSALQFLARAGIIGALYAALTLIVYPLSFGAIQLRFSEVLTVLPVFFPEAIPGLFAGCAVANLLSPNIALWDVIFGSLATLMAAICTHCLRKRPVLAVLPPVIFNALIVGAVITLSESSEQSFAVLYGMNALTVGLGEAVICLAGGLPLIRVLRKIFVRQPENPPQQNSHS